MFRASGLALTLAIVTIVADQRASGQMFGPRELGGFLSRRNSPGALRNPAEALVNPGGALTGNERFLRGNRSVTDFVGSDLSDRRGFVGAVQARQRRVPPAAATARERRRPNVNRPTPEDNSPNRPYPPRLVLGPGLSGPTSIATASSLERHLLETPIQWVQPLEVRLVGRTAVLRGEVSSAEDRRLAAALAGFEPGVSHVQNDLRVATPPAMRAPREPRREPVPVTPPNPNRQRPRQEF